MVMKLTEQNSEGRERCGLSAKHSMRIIKVAGRAKNLMMST
jgi:hypothetical protein